MTSQTFPRSKSIQRLAKSQLNADEKRREKSKKSLDSFQNLAQNMGVGANNPLTSATYGFNPITRNRTLLEWAYRGSWMAGVVVDSVADDMTRAGVEFKGEIDTEQAEDIHQAATSMGLWNAINDGCKWSRLYGGAIVVMLIDGQDPATPLRLNTIRKGQFRGLLTLDRWMIEPSLSDLVTDLGPNLGLPKFYSVTGQAPALSGMKIHYSRCMRMEGYRLPYWQRIMENMWGISSLERIYDRMIAFDSASTGAAQLVYKSYLRTYKIESMREIVSAGGDALSGFVKYVEMMRQFQGIEGVTLMDKEDEFEGITHQAFSGLADILSQFAQQVSGAAEIPLVRLFGQSPMGFSTGETDIRNYYDNIRQKQEKELRTGVSTIYRVLAASEDIKLEKSVQMGFKPLWQLSDKEKAEIAASITTAVTSAEGSGLVRPETALRELKKSSDITGVWAHISDEEITEAENRPDPLPEVGAPGEVQGQAHGGSESQAERKDPGAAGGSES